MAGRADVICFDKTGTLTKDNVIFEGAALPHTDASQLDVAPPATLMTTAADVTRALGSCHALVNYENELIGDPLEAAVVRGMNWIVNRTGDSHADRGQTRQAVQVLRRFQFNRYVRMQGRCTTNFA